jgi:eukaryotic-like serine/threonine-protein kinase
VTWLSDKVLAHLCQVADWPDLTGTRYELIDKIGQGGMGTVFRAHDRELDRAVAIKVLSAAPDQAKARMEREARITARLEHPSIVPVHDSGVLPDGRFFYAMKLVRGQRLDQPGAIPVALAETLQLFQRICEAVAFAHAHGVIHRDLKPQNIMRGAFGEVLVLDWGLAQIAPIAQQRGEEGRETLAEPPGTIAGTPGYMAPEQARGDIADVDERADVYALGAILSFLVTGKDPGPGLVAVPALPRPIQAICRKALARDRDQRYAAASELGADVAAYLAGQRVAAYPEGYLGSALRLGTKYRAILGLIFAYLVMRILLLVFAGP